VLLTPKRRRRLVLLPFIREGLVRSRKRAPTSRMTPPRPCSRKEVNARTTPPYFHIRSCSSAFSYRFRTSFRPFFLSKSVPRGLPRALGAQVPSPPLAPFSSPRGPSRDVVLSFGDLQRDGWFSSNLDEPVPSFIKSEKIICFSSFSTLCRERNPPCSLSGALPRPQT